MLFHQDKNILCIATKQETAKNIRRRTDHLKGLKIGIMGCIVNGPGEMADADYGYVGKGPGKITLYKEQTVVEKNISEIEILKIKYDINKSFFSIIIKIPFA